MPSDSVADWIVSMVPSTGTGWSPPGMLGIGVGGTAEKAMLLAKQSMTAQLDMLELKPQGPRDALEAIRIDTLDRITIAKSTDPTDSHQGLLTCPSHSYSDCLPSY